MRRTWFSLILLQPVLRSSWIWLQVLEIRMSSELSLNCSSPSCTGGIWVCPCIWSLLTVSVTPWSLWMLSDPSSHSPAPPAPLWWLCHLPLGSPWHLQPLSGGSVTPGSLWWLCSPTLPSCPGGCGCSSIPRISFQPAPCFALSQTI